MGETKHENDQRVTRQEAAEGLTDIAYALMTGGQLNLGRGRQVTVPVADEVVMRREGRSIGDRVEVKLELSWATGEESH